MSEVTVKRLLISGDPSLKRLAAICELIGMSLFDLAAISESQKQKDYVFTEEQEKAFVADERLYYLFLSLFSHDVETLQNEYKLTSAYISKCLRKLEKLGLIEGHPNNRIKMLVKGSMTWIKNGPMQSQFMLNRHLEYAESLTKSKNDQTTYLASTEGKLSAESLQNMANELKSVVEKYQQVAAREKLIYDTDKLLPFAWLVGVGGFKREIGKIFEIVD